MSALGGRRKKHFTPKETLKNKKCAQNVLKKG
jgi:hypothetical protein